MQNFAEMASEIKSLVSSSPDTYASTIVDPLSGESLMVVQDSPASPQLYLSKLSQFEIPHVIEISSAQVIALMQLTPSLLLPQPRSASLLPSFRANLIALSHLLSHLRRIDRQRKWTIQQTEEGAQISCLLKGKRGVKQTLIEQRWATLPRLMAHGVNARAVHNAVVDLNSHGEDFENYYNLAYVSRRAEIPGDSHTQRYLYILNHIAQTLTVKNPVLVPIRSTSYIECRKVEIQDELRFIRGIHDLQPFHVVMKGLRRLLLLSPNEIELFKLLFSHLGYVDLIIARRFFPTMSGEQLSRAVKSLGTKLALAFNESFVPMIANQICGYSLEGYNRIGYLSHCAKPYLQRFSVGNNVLKIWNIQATVDEGIELPFMPVLKQRRISSYVEINGDPLEVNSFELKAIQLLITGNGCFSSNKTDISSEGSSRNEQISICAGYRSLCEKLGLDPIVEKSGRAVNYYIPVKTTPPELD
jgi:hypothetical protein